MVQDRGLVSVDVVIIRRYFSTVGSHRKMRIIVAEKSRFLNLENVIPIAVVFSFLHELESQADSSVNSCSSTGLSTPLRIRSL